jgi:hypothetical protein
MKLNSREQFYKVSKRLSAFFFNGIAVRKQNCLILKKKKLKIFEQFSSPKNTLYIPGHRYFGEQSENNVA